MKKMSETLKTFTPHDKGIKLVSEPSDFDEFDQDPGVLRAVLSCGHVTDPNSLTDCCKSQLDSGQTEFECPLCEETWPYDEVRKLAKLTLEEQLSFEEKLGTNTAKKIVDFRVCPGCSLYVERSDVSNLCVECSVCTERTGESYQFCWNCLGEWKESLNRADRCGNAGCSNDKKLLKDCPIISLTDVHENARCPEIRACTSCGVLIEHTAHGCNNMDCPECDNEFCFICLNPGHDYDEDLPCELAPRQ
ncbi:potential E3 ubiquitin-protein ligase ariadne-2-like [Puntigrus tetrazona]|uniref:potential E3 ubiquitin-protein ligase ariadne-2-like n=1 Tax=Puntigrus tetrazona TaxID=1606681 RepID=UPI001C8A72F1|nr:potential E3 ubiquitin-protein ligase ariadne-2-like [Puntigrus tetrazona]